MKYLKLPRARLLLTCFLASSLLLAVFPSLDLRVSGLFHDGTSFYLASRWWAKLLHESLGYLLSGSLMSVLALYAFNKLSGRPAWGVNGRTVLYLLVVLGVGAGLVVNVVFKNNFGRARPRNVEEFGGPQAFTPAFVVSSECSTNCSFSSGDGAGAFFSLALALALSRRRSMLMAGCGFGALVSFARVASGAHFLSDTVVSFFVMLIVADVAYFYMVHAEPEAVQTPAVPALPRRLPAPAVRGWVGAMARSRGTRPIARRVYGPHGER